MKLINFLAIASPLISALEISRNGLHNVLTSSNTTNTQTGLYVDSNLVNGSFQKRIQEALDAGYTNFYVGYYLSLYGCQAACLEWSKQLSGAQRTQVKNLLAQYNAKIYLSIGGPSEFWENCIDDREVSNCPSVTAGNATNWAIKYQFDGVDFNVDLQGEGTVKSPYANNGSFANLVFTMISTAVSTSNGQYSNSDMVLSSSAPYYSPSYIASSDASTQLSYSLANFCLNNHVGRCILKMFNEGDNYMTYTDIFKQNTYNDPIYGLFGAGSAVQELVNLGIDQNMLTVLKPVVKDDITVRDGWVDPIQLNDYGCLANSQFGWTGGFTAWALDYVTVSDFSKITDFAEKVNAECA